jgi:Integrase core domain/Chromo (CHRromatin Organisation MOdifier) domain
VETAPPPLGRGTPRDGPNEVIHFDFLYMGPSHTGFKYLLLIKDDLSGYVWFVPSTNADAAAVVDALTSWFASFGVATTCVSDRGSHFKNRVIDGVRHALKSRHHFITAYCPWANGTVERACKEVLRACRALLSEFRLVPASWPEVYKLIQAILNNSVSPQRGNYAPLTAAFTGRPADNPLLHTDTGTPMKIAFIRLRQLLHIEELCTAVAAVHKQAADIAGSGRSKSRVSSRKALAAYPSLEVGDFVLVARRDHHAGDKLTLRWRGPQRIVGTLSDHVYEVQDLVNDGITSVHISRLRFYHDPSLDISADLLAQISHNNQGYTVQSLVDLRYDPEGQEFLVLVSWLGFEPHENTWEPLLQLSEDIPDLVRQFLAVFDNVSLAVNARDCLEY